MFFLVVLVVLLALPMALYAQETDLAALAIASDEAVNAGDLEGVLSYYADDAVFETVPFNTYTGIEEIRAYMEEAIALNATVESEVLQVEGDTVTLRSRYTDDDLRALGLTLEGIQVVTFRDGKVVSSVWTATDETMAALEAAMVALPETGGEALPMYAVLGALGGLAILGALGAELLRRRGCQTC
jgi:ketosteroid isomerase-like protein